MTVSAMVLGDAPGYCPLTTTVGGTTSGYSLIGRAGMASRPPTTMRIASTVAKMGRSMKAEEIFNGLPSLIGNSRRRLLLVGGGHVGLHGHALGGYHQA